MLGSVVPHHFLGGSGVDADAGFLKQVALHSVAPKEEVSLLPGVEDAVLLLAIAANCALILAPLRSSLRAARSEMSPTELVGLLAPTFLLFGQSYFWGVYGFFTSQPDIYRFNTFGAAMCIVYLCIMCKGAQEQERIQVHVATAVGTSVFASVFVAFILPMPDYWVASILAFLATAFSMLQSAAPMKQALEVLKAKSSPQEFPLGVAGFSCVSSFLWAQYAWMAKDFLFWLPNAINALVGAVELALVLWVSRRLSLSSPGNETMVEDVLKSNVKALEEEFREVGQQVQESLGFKVDYRYGKLQQDEPEFEPEASRSSKRDTGEMFEFKPIHANFV